MPANNPIGYSFAPTFENAEMASANPGAGAPQGPLQTLSYRLKRTPAVLRQSPLITNQSSGAVNSALIESVLKTVLGPEAAAQFIAQIGGAGEMGRQTPPRQPMPSPSSGAPSSPGLPMAPPSGAANPFAPPTNEGMLPRPFHNDAFFGGGGGAGNNNRTPAPEFNVWHPPIGRGDHA